MKKILTLAIAAALSSPMALAANTPDTVGNVTYLGNIVANSPMWQWTVNDYPGGRLDAKPSTAITASGVTTYPLNGQSFIAVSGYLPSFVDINSGPRGGAVGVRDITALTDQAGAPIADITDAGPGATTFTIAASGKNARGQDVNGKLVLKGTELRAVRGATAPDEGNNNGTLRIMMAATSQLAKPTPRGSCFSGSGAYANAKDVLGGTATNPTAGTASATAYQALFSAFDAADAQGTAPRYATIKNSRYGTDAISTDFSGSGCNVATTWNGVRATSDKWSYLYIAGAHVLELTPLSLKFSEPLSGAWSSTLTVTAYQM